MTKEFETWAANLPEELQELIRALLFLWEHTPRELLHGPPEELQRALDVNVTLYRQIREREEL